MRALAVIVALFAVLAAACGSGEETSPPTTTTTTESAPPQESSSRPPAPAIEGTTLDGEAISLAELRGRPVLVNVWSSW